MGELYTTSTNEGGNTVYKCSFCAFETPEQILMARHHNEMFKDRCPGRPWQTAIPTEEEKKKRRQERRKARRLKKKLLAQGVDPAKIAEQMGETGEGDDEDDDDGDDDDDDGDDEETVVHPNSPASAPQPPGESIYKERLTPNKILFSTLRTHPDLGPQHVSEVMSWAELRGQLHPMEVAHLLSQMKGVTDRTANLVAQKYTLALQKEAQNPEANIQMTGLLAAAPPGGSPVFQMGGGIPPPGQLPSAFNPQQQRGPSQQQTIGQPQPLTQYSPFQVPQPQGQMTPEMMQIQQVIQQQNEVIKQMQAEMQRREQDAARREQERQQEAREAALERRFQTMEQQMREDRQAFLDKLDDIGSSKEEAKIAEVQRDIFGKLEGNAMELRERLRDIEGKVVEGGGSDTLKVELAKLNKQTEVLTKSLTNAHETLGKGIDSWVKLQQKSPIEGADLPASQFTERELKAMEKQLKKGK